MKIKWILTGIIITVILLNTPGCNKLENLSESTSLLIVSSITGEDIEGNAGSTTIFADVITSSGGIFNDSGTAALYAVLVDPLQGDSTYYQDIIVDQVDIEYSRSDMADAIEGVDIPFGFSQKVHSLVTIEGTGVEMPFVLVQHTAKLESPLVELTNLNQEIILKLEAKCTFYGKDVAGHRVAPAVGYVSVWIANFADED